VRGARSVGRAREGALARGLLEGPGMRTMVATALLALAGCGAVGGDPIAPSSMAESDGAIVTGAIVDGEDGLPIAGARACFAGTEESGAAAIASECAPSDRSGTYALAGLPRGERVAIAFAGEHYAPSLALLSTGAGETAHAQSLVERGAAMLLAEAAGAPLDGTRGALRVEVAASDGGAPPPGLTIALGPPSGTGPLYLGDDGMPDRSLSATGEAGLAAVLGLPPGDYRLRFAHPLAACVPVESWPTDDPRETQVRIAAGTITTVRLLCLREGGG